MTAMSNVLFGAVCLDIYNQGEYRRPGCGILHNAYHLQKLGANPLLITRIGEQQAAFFLDFFHTHQIAILPEQITAPGAPAFFVAPVSNYAVVLDIRLRRLTRLCNRHRIRPSSVWQPYGATDVGDPVQAHVFDTLRSYAWSALRPPSCGGLFFARYGA